MRREEIINYLKTYLAQGYSKEVLYQQLVSQGYNAKELEFAFREIEREKVKILKSSIKQLKREGHRKEEIVNILVGQGYSQEFIRKVVGNEEGKHSFIIILIGILIIIVLSYLAFTYLTPSEKVKIPHSNLDNVTKKPIPRNETDDYTIRKNPTPDIIQNNTNKTIEEAKEECKKILEEDNKDNCFLSLAEDKYKPEICENITDVEKRDQCYLKFVYNGDIEQCEKLQLEYNKDFCKILEEY